MNKLLSLLTCLVFVMINQGLCNAIDPPDKVVGSTPYAEQASFVGGQRNLKQFIRNHLEYPEKAREYAIEGLVTISFYVLKDGSIHRPFVEQSLNDDCNQAALDLIKQMPNWEPATSGGLPVPSKKRLTFRFKIR